MYGQAKIPHNVNTHTWQTVKENKKKKEKLSLMF